MVRDYMVENYLSIQDLKFLGFKNTYKCFADSKLWKKDDVVLMLDRTKEFSDVYKVYNQLEMKLNE